MSWGVALAVSMVLGTVAVALIALAVRSMWREYGKMAERNEEQHRRVMRDLYGVDMVKRKGKDMGEGIGGA